MFTTAEDPRKVLRQLIKNLWGRFDWAPLKEGNGQWLSQILNREQPGPNGLEDMLTAEHRRCDDLVAESEAAAQEVDRACADALF